MYIKGKKVECLVATLNLHFCFAFLYSKKKVVIKIT